MEKLIFTRDDNKIEEINAYLKDGWQIKDIKCSGVSSMMSVLAYIILEKNDNSRI